MSSFLYGSEVQARLNTLRCYYRKFNPVRSPGPIPVEHPGGTRFNRTGGTGGVKMIGWKKMDSLGGAIASTLPIDKLNHDQDVTITGAAMSRHDMLFPEIPCRFENYKAFYHLGLFVIE